MLDPDAAVVLLGSWGRHEVTSASDDDAIVLFCGERRDGARPEPGVVAQPVRRPGARPGGAVRRDGLARRPDRPHRARRTTRTRTSPGACCSCSSRVPVAGDTAYAAAREALLGTYLRRPRARLPPAALPAQRPRPLLAHDRGRLRGQAPRPRRGGAGACATRSCASAARCCSPAGCCPCSSATRCRRPTCPRCWPIASPQPPLDRVAQAFLDHGMPDAGARAIRAYAQFLDLLDDPDARRELAALTEAGRRRLRALPARPRARRRAAGRAARAAVRDARPRAPCARLPHLLSSASQ